MISDIASTDGTLSCDICIVGSGVIGLALMRELRRSRLRVIVLESGGRGREGAIDDIQASEVLGEEFLGAREGRVRQLGGTSNIWGGQALPMDPIDFMKRDWIPRSGWPLDPKVLPPLYARASDFLGVDHNDYDKDVFNRFKISLPQAFPAHRYRYHVSKWAPNAKLIDVYRRGIERADSLQVICHATVTDITLSPNGSSVEHLVARSLDGRHLRVSARQFVLAVGAIEVARLLLASGVRGGRPIGGGNAHIGRYLMDHPSGPIGSLVPKDSRAVQRLFNVFYIGRRKFSARISLLEAAQQEHRLLNVSCGFNFQSLPGSGIDVLRRGAGAVRSRDTRAVTKAALAAVPALPGLIAWGYRRAIDRRAYDPGSKIGLVVNAEQPPMAENRVELSLATDSMGIPRSRINWHPTAATERTVRWFANHLECDFRTSGIGSLKLEPWVSALGAGTSLRDAFHPMGTARMARSARDGVVDVDGRLFGVDNLSIAGTAVFPTSGHSNPTLTAIALAIGLADRLKIALLAS